MQAIEIRGIIPAMATPFNQDESVNIDALRQLTNYLIDGGIHGLFSTGGQGEFWALTVKEKEKIWAVVLDEAKGRVPVYAGTGGITTREAINLNRAAARVGVDAVSVITPFFVRPTENELYHHYTAIADASSLPILLYNNPGRTGGVNLSPELVVRLAAHPQIVGVKDSSGDLTLTMEYIRRTEDDFVVLLGRDSLIFAGLIHGAKGSITSTANVVPALVSRIYDAFVAGDIEGALAAQWQLAPLRQAFSLGTFPVVVKEALKMVGIPAGPARGPVRTMAPDNRQKLWEVLSDIGAPLRR